MTTTDGPAAPITAPECAEQAAAVLRIAGTESQANRSPEGAAALVEVAHAWIGLGAMLAQHAAMNRPPADDR
jgi:hypothetical protein